MGSSVPSGSAAVGETSGERPPRARAPLVVSLIVSLALVVMWWLWVGIRSAAHIDHLAFLRTHGYMRAGEGYYAAMRQAFLDIDTTIGHARGYRLPSPFWFWELFPPGALYGLFLVIVVLGSTVLLTRITARPLVIPWVTLFLLYAGRSTGFANEASWESWMLVELWVVPLILGSVVAWRQRRDGWSAALAAAATLCRETAAVLLIGGLLAALV
ncbi:MAG TPA: hypothetical protein VK866_11805, partial [Acidimicrobiales bacterium]|nr:hypothetical protein [Acidimicrobiales bacterium]